MVYKLLAVLAWLTGSVNSLSVSDSGSVSRSIEHLDERPSRKSSELSASILQSLRQATSTERPLDLETDFYDPSTGLHSEGVWHNCLAGMASVRLGDVTPALEMARALYRYSWDGTSFQRRAWSGNWDHSRLLSDDNPPEQAHYYQASSEHRCVQHGMALVLWSMLCQCSSAELLPADRELLCKQQKLVADQFMSEFWDDGASKWTTIGRSQGGGTTLRPSASSGRPARLEKQSSSRPYYRAVDQAIALLACLENIRVLGRTGQVDQAAKWTDLTHRACQTLLTDFGYEDVRTSQTYLGLPRNRNFWHEGWVLLSLIQAERYLTQKEKASPSHDGLVAIWQGLVDRYGHVDDKEGSWDGTVWHWSVEQKEDASNVRYCGDNVLALAMCRSLGVLSPVQEKGFWGLVHVLLNSSDRAGLVSVADVYPQVRLHPNTELAALLVWP